LIEYLSHHSPADLPYLCLLYGIIGKKDVFPAPKMDIPQNLL